MTNGKGIEAVRARIEAAFRTLHNDCRDKEQVEADRELHAAIQPAERDEVPHSVNEVETTDMEHHERVLRVRSKYLYRAALRGPHASSHKTLPRGIHQCFEVNAPAEPAEELFRQGLKKLLEGE